MMESLQASQASHISTMPPPAHIWLDMPDGIDRVGKRLEQGLITDCEAEMLLSFREQGFVIFPQVFDAETMRRVREELKSIYLEKEKYLVRMTLREKNRVVPPGQPVLPPKSRLLDYYVHSELARNMVLCSTLTRFLCLLYDEAPLAFQSLLFTWGTEHSIHADNTFIVADPPCSLMASWIALEDIQPGSGELVYYPGSHRDPVVVFDGDDIAWRQGRDGKMAHKEYTDFLRSRADQIKPEAFLAKEGDIIFWHANLIHYGTAVIHEHTRRSLLTHYCPANATPNYFNFFNEAYKRRWNDGYYSTRRYDIRPGSINPLPVFRG